MEDVEKEETSKRHAIVSGSRCPSFRVSDSIFGYVVVRRAAAQMRPITYAEGLTFDCKEDCKKLRRRGGGLDQKSENGRSET